MAFRYLFSWLNTFHVLNYYVQYANFDFRKFPGSFLKTLLCLFHEPTKLSNYLIYLKFIHKWWKQNWMHVCINNDMLSTHILKVFEYAVFEHHVILIRSSIFNYFAFTSFCTSSTTSFLISNHMTWILFMFIFLVLYNMFCYYKLCGGETLIMFLCGWTSRCDNKCYFMFCFISNYYWIQNQGLLLLLYINLLIAPHNKQIYAHIQTKNYTTKFPKIKSHSYEQNKYFRIWVLLLEIWSFNEVHIWLIICIRVFFN